MCSILLVEDSPLVRNAIKELLTKTLENAVISEAEDAQEALCLVRAQPFDVAILDIGLSGHNGTDLIRNLMQACATLKILVLSLFPEPQDAARVFQSGGHGYLRKNADPNGVVRAVKTVLRGDRYVSDAVAQELVKSRTMKLPHETLSGLEYQVFQELVAGKSLTEIAERLHLNVTTVSTYRSRVLEKTHVKTNADLVRYAIHHNLVP